MTHAVSSGLRMLNKLLNIQCAPDYCLTAVKLEGKPELKDRA